jgi:hypothetical protein
MHAVGDLAGQLERPRAADGADLQRHMILDRSRSREQSGVAVELPLEVDLSFVQRLCAHVMRFAEPA